ncbi:MAG: endonuclease/exonuclease/phosphatase family protein [Planctomycetota bacterium]
MRIRTIVLIPIVVANAIGCNPSPSDPGLVGSSVADGTPLEAPLDELEGSLTENDSDADTSSPLVRRVARGLDADPTELGPDRNGFSIMTWNLEWFWDDESRDNYSDLSVQQSAPSREDWNWRRDAVAASIASVRPTVLAVQEIESQRVLWYLTRALDRDHKLDYDDYNLKSDDHFTEQDVGLLVGSPADVRMNIKCNVTADMKSSGRYGSVSKHMITEVLVPVGDRSESVWVINVHLKAGADSDSRRSKQVETLNAWIDQLIPGGPSGDSPHLIVLGDFNTEQSAGRVGPASEIGLLLGRGTSDPSDDLIDLHDRIPHDQRRTHLLDGKQFDRILVSRSLVDDTSGESDLTLVDVVVLPELAIRNGRDTQEAHWDAYWQMPESDRDLSDHYPVLARFEVR